MRYQEVGRTRREGDASHSTRCRHCTRNSLPANATRAIGESYFSDKGEVSSWRTNQRASCTLAEKGREISNDDKRWDDRTDQMTFEVRKGDTTVCSVWTNSVRNAFRKQAGWAKLQEARASAAKHWTERVWYHHNQRWLQASREGTEASKSGSFKDEREWGKKCFEDLDQRRMGRPATRTWSTDFLLREGSSREEIGKWLKNKSIPWQRPRRLLQVLALFRTDSRW